MADQRALRKGRAVSERPSQEDVDWMASRLREMGCEILDLRDQCNRRHHALLRISQMRALLDQSDSDTLKLAIALADEALREAT